MLVAAGTEKMNLALRLVLSSSISLELSETRSQHKTSLKILKYLHSIFACYVLGVQTAATHGFHRHAPSISKICRNQP